MCARSHRADRIASIIVSDEPLSRETNYRTEFVAVLNNQPQGGFITRRPTVEVPVASGDDFGNNGFGFFSSAIGTPNPNSNPWQRPSARRPIQSTDVTALVDDRVAAFGTLAEFQKRN